MDSYLLIALASIVVLGIMAQWLSWRIHLPSILLLLFIGVVAGPVTGLIDPDEIFGDLLFPVVSLAVGLILFEGGLSLKLSELRQIGRILPMLIIIGSGVTWIIGTLAATHILGLDPRISLLLGAVLIVTGPTVIGPILRQVRPSGQVGSILKWESILIDPLGATLALLVFEAILIGERNEAAREIVLAIVKTLFYGGLSGLIGGVLLAQALRRFWIPDFLQNSCSIMMVFAVFATSNTLQHESGLLAVTVMGIFLANQKSADIYHIVEFKENLRVLLISGLFIVLAARLDTSELQSLPLASVLFLAVLVLVARPLGVALATAGSALKWQERAFIGSLAPRGIVAASVSSIFALRLAEENIADAEYLAPVTFLVILGTVTIYGFSAAPLGRWLNVAEPVPRGLLMISALPWVRALGKALHDEGVPVLLADTNRINIRAARMAGLRTFMGNILAEYGTDEIDFGGIGHMLALTPNDETNSLMSLHFTEVFGRSEVYQLVSADAEDGTGAGMPERLRGRELFGAQLNHDVLQSRFGQGGEIKRTPLTDEFTYEHFKEHYGDKATPLLLLDEDGKPRLWTAHDPPKPQAGQLLFSLVAPNGEVD